MSGPSRTVLPWHPFAVRQGIVHAEQRGWVVRQHAKGPKGRPYTVIRGDAGWRRCGPERAGTGQRGHSWAVKAADVGQKLRRRRGSTLQNGIANHLDSAIPFRNA